MSPTARVYHNFLDSPSGLRITRAAREPGVGPAGDAYPQCEQWRKPLFGQLSAATGFLSMTTWSKRVPSKLTSNALPKPTT